MLISTLYLRLLMMILLGYALAGKGFAYIGFPPFYIGELVLLIGLATLLTQKTTSRVVVSTPLLLWGLLLVWTMLRTVPYVREYGMLALRDAALVGYGLFAVIIAALLAQRPDRLTLLIHWFRKLCVIFPAVVLPLMIIQLLYPYLIPTVGSQSIPIIRIKNGDVQVLTAGIMLFSLFGFHRIGLFRLVLLVITISFAAANNRGGMLGFTTAMIVGLYLGRSRISVLTRVGKFSLIIVVLAGAALLFDLGTNPNERGRSISVPQLAENFASIFSQDESGSLSSTKYWRIRWWSTILDYSLTSEYWWKGKGFGINLADDDGFQVFDDGSLRSPHNAHMHILARGGVFAFALWVSAHAAWVFAIVRQMRRARKLGDEQWQRFFAFLLAFWTAFLVNATFDVYLEGPMGAIWYWTIFGVGVGAVWLFDHAPQVLKTPAPVATESPQPATTSRLALS